MSTTWEKKGTNDGELSFEISIDEISKGLDSAFARIKKNLSVPGFRKGKVSRQVFNRMYGEASLYEDALNIVLPEDNRGVLFGVIKDCYKEPVKDAVVKLIEVDCEHGKEERKPVSHTFTDEEGEFVFGPLCPDKKYEIQIFVDRVKHVKVCAKCHREGKCLKGVDLKKCDCFVGEKEDFEKCKEHCCDEKDEGNVCR